MTAFIHGVVLFGTYAILWFLTFFSLLSVGLGSEHDPDTGAPLNPRLGLKALIATAVATVLWVGFYLLVAFKVFDL